MRRRAEGVGAGSRGQPTTNDQTSTGPRADRESVAQDGAQRKTCGSVAAELLEEHVMAAQVHV